MRTVSIAITHFNRFSLLVECLESVLCDPRIGEVVIVDDASTDDSYERIKEFFGDDPRVKLFRNDKNLDCYINKAIAVRHCKGEWVILFDSDNVMQIGYINTLFAIDPWDKDTVYCPDFAAPLFNYTAFSGLTITRQNVGQYLRRPHFQTALNTANYFFHRDTYLEVWDGNLDPHTADSIYQAYRLLAAGKKLAIVPGLRYFHRVHDGSHYKQNHHKTGNFARVVEKLLTDLK